MSLTRRKVRSSSTIFFNLKVSSVREQNHGPCLWQALNIYPVVHTGWLKFKMSCGHPTSIIEVMRVWKATMEVMLQHYRDSRGRSCGWIVRNTLKLSAVGICCHQQTVLPLSTSFAIVMWGGRAENLRNSCHRVILDDNETLHATLCWSTNMLITLLEQREPARAAGGLLSLWQLRLPGFYR